MVLCVSFAAAGATARLLRARSGGSVTFAVTGDDGRADEDLACAQYIAQAASGDEADAASFLRRAAASPAVPGLADAARRGFPGVHRDE